MYNFDDNQVGISETKLIGGYQCYLPIGWYRHALRVVDKYPDDQRWLGSNNVKGEWPIAYHGTRVHAIKSIVNQSLLPRYAKVDAQRMDAVQKNGSYFDKVGVYVATHCNGGAHPAYTVPFTVQTSSKKTECFRVVVQCRIRPDSFTRHIPPVVVGESWRIVDPAAIRPVAILLKNEETADPHENE